MRSQWITVKYPADVLSRIARPKSTLATERFTTRATSAYGTGCGHGEEAERDFAAHRIDEDGY